MTPDVHGFFDKATNTISYVVACPESSQCAIIDSVLDFEQSSGRTSYQSADAIISFVESRGFTTQWVLETHIHADHLSAAPYMKSKLGGRLGIGSEIMTVQEVFGKYFNAGPDFPKDGRQFDVLMKDDHSFSLGEIPARTLHTPGHTPACMTYIIGDCAFVGDTLFMPDFGTARADFPGGDARQLFQSIHKVLSLPDETKLFMCHDYKAPGRDEFRWQTTVADEKAGNIHIAGGVSEDDFVKMRTERDATLATPRLMLPSVQVNMRAGELPPAEDNGVHYLKIPIDVI